MPLFARLQQQTLLWLRQLGQSLAGLVPGSLGGWPLLWSVISPQPLPELDDQALVELAQARGQKDDRPFRELWRRHQRMVWHICYSFTANAQDAEDLVQEVFFKAFRSLTGFEGRSSFKTWLHRVAVNTAQNEIRRRSRRPQTGDLPVEEMAEYLAADNVSVEQTYQQQRLAQIVAATFARLRPDEYELLYLKDVEDRPYADIADQLGIGLSAAKMRVQRARIAFQAHYRQLQDEFV